MFAIAVQLFAVKCGQAKTGSRFSRKVDDEFK